MIVFAIGGTTFGMAEESLAFYVLIITVMIAAGYDALVGASILLLGCGIGVLGSTINPFATGIASGFAGTSLDRGHPRPDRHPRHRHGDRDLVRHALRREGEGRSQRLARVLDKKAENEARFLAGSDPASRIGRADRPPEGWSSASSSPPSR